MAERLPTAPGAVVNIDGDRAMRTKFGNWVSEGVFILTDKVIAAERFVVEFDPDSGEGDR